MSKIYDEIKKLSTELRVLDGELLPLVSSLESLQKELRDTQARYNRVLKDVNVCRSNKINILEQLAVLAVTNVPPVEVTPVFFNPELCNMSIDILKLDTRSKGALRLENIRYIGELIQRTEDDLIDKTNLGRVSARKIREKLAEYNLNLGSDIGGWNPPKS